MKALVLACCVLLSFPGSESAQKQAMAEHVDQIPPAAPPLTFDPSVPLGSRITLPPDSVLRRYGDMSNPSVTFHALTEAERAQVESVLQELPAFARQVFAGHVRSISFVDGIPGNATTIKEDGSGLPTFNIVLRAGLLHETVSQFLTRKERNYYSEAGSDITLSIEAGSLPAVLYVLLHESVHVLEISNRAGKEGPPQLFASSPPDLLVHGIWENARTKAPAYESPLFKLSWFGSGKPERIEAAEPTYLVLSRTPFVSLYGSSNWYDDIAELVTCYYLTQILKQPYSIVLRKGSETLYLLKPMNSKLVQERFPMIMPIFGLI